MLVYFVAGEASADNHGAALMQALQLREPNIQFVGRGGPKMKAVAGADFHDWIEESGVLGLWEVVKRYPYFRTQFHAVLKEIQNAKPDAVVLIDYPGFNLRLARALRKKSPRVKVVYYISPQVWAWNRGRIQKMARWVDLMLCIFPFEADLYNRSQLRSIFVGHPMMDRLPSRRLQVERDRNLIGLFPGSRARELRKIFPILIETVDLLREARPALHFVVAAASSELAREAEQTWNRHLSRRRQPKADPAYRNEAGQGHVALEIKVGETDAIMQRAAVGIVASGSATLEAAYFQMPFILVYKVAWPTYLAARSLLKVKYIGMPNVLAERAIVPEFIQHRARPRELAEAVGDLMDDAEARQRMITNFNAIISSLGEGGASDKAAAAILDELGVR